MRDHPVAIYSNHQLRQDKYSGRRCLGIPVGGYEAGVVPFPFYVGCVNGLLISAPFWLLVWWLA